ncbi:hypothetical protein SPRG_21201 [Saprolegnia parasitica CBS 223.65]|uniref:Uncharacterized protein n=1 Tax=Saprolegnia parasitica (strain CBS 223.65) TaxID=695850 RepID=A0A067BTT3_SAPPC|nr:hypothetical protein SPRG_21201 [Saprolegnia parasitica CBS 223.65]KDO21954.1 hypothetical protein SPRG_21201 [Saprolegnia parasitica CBS 223.65]|eukprot:XP_012207335.1 hypothetical protein SPRG_21201 [Saprolegnia parasitica CBS 223.65]
MLPYGSGTQELKHIRIARASSASEVSWKHVAVGATVAVATLGYAATMHSMVSNQAAALDALHAQMLAMGSVKPLKHAAPAIDALPHKYAVENVTPRKTQDLQITRYIPCVGDLTKDPRCDVASPLCTLCPPGIPTTCCITTKGGEDYNMDGEFTSHYGMEAEGGHAMTIVGYNDEYTTKDGYTGGYILKNSWWDGVDPPLGPVHARGSHSIRYFMQEISEFEERFNCPNSANPANWYQCQGRVGVIHADAGVIRAPINASLVAYDECLSDDTRRDAASSFSPLRLSCTNDAFCKANATYFVRNSTAVGDGFQAFCFFEYLGDGNSSDVCLPAMLPTDLAHAFAPIEAEAYANNPDVCGFYFYPYAKQRAGAALGWEVSADDLDVTWAPQSYAANARKFPTLDYTLVCSDTARTMDNISFC